MADTSGKAIASLVFGIFSVLLAWIPLIGFVVIVLAIVFGFLGLKEINKGEKKGTGLAIAGIVLGFISLFLSVLIGIASFAYFGVLSPEAYVAEKCLLSGGIVCLDHSWDSTNGFRLQVQNAAGFDMTGVRVSLAGTGCTAVGSGETFLSDGQYATYSFGECSDLVGSYKGTLEVTFTNVVTGEDGSKLGELAARAG